MREEKNRWSVEDGEAQGKHWGGRVTEDLKRRGEREENVKREKKRE